jgi:hypothetical protein
VQIPTCILLFHRCPKKMENCFKYEPYEHYVKVTKHPSSHVLRTMFKQDYPCAAGCSMRLQQHQLSQVVCVQ